MIKETLEAVVSKKTVGHGDTEVSVTVYLCDKNRRPLGFKVGDRVRVTVESLE